MFKGPADSPLIQLSGPAALWVDGQQVALPTRRSLAIVAIAALEGRQVGRDELTRLLWGPGRRRNLRQELYWLRRAPQASAWLSVTREGVSVQLRRDLDELPLSEVLATLLQGLGGITDPLDDWIAEQRVRFADRTGAAGLVGESDRALPGRDPAQRVALALALCEQVPEPEVLASALGIDVLRLIDALEGLEAVGSTVRGALTSEQRWQLRAGASPTVVRALHGRLASCLDGVAGAEAERAHHLEWAGDPRAAEVWLSVGRTGRDPDALQRSFDAARSDLQRLEALAALVEHHRQRREAPEATQWMHALDALALSCQHPVVLARAAAIGALLAIGRGDGAAAESALLRAREAGAAKVYVDWAQAAIWTVTGQHARAEPLLRTVIREGGPRLRMQALNALGACRAMAGDVEAADPVHHEALALARSLGDRVLALRLLNSLGANASRTGRLAEASERFGEAVSLSKELSDVEAERIASGNLASVLIHQGRLGAARPMVAAAVAEMGVSPRSQGWAWHLRGELERSCGRYSEASVWDARAAGAYREASDAGLAARSEFNVVLARLFVGESVLRDLQDALSILEQTGRADLTRLARLDFAEVCGDADVAEAVVDGLRSPSTGSLALRIEGMRQRIASLRDRDAPCVVDDPALGLGSLSVARVRTALCAAALAGRDPIRADALREAVRESVRDDAQGLLSSQREAWLARTESLLRDPLRGPTDPA